MMRQPDDVKPQASVARPPQADGLEPPVAARALPAPFGEWALFLRRFMRHPGRVGAVIPSSARLEQRLVRCARAAQARVVVELGPGTGGTTRALLAAMRPDARLLAIEIDPALHAHAANVIRDPRLTVHLGSAEQLAEALAIYQLPAPDVVVSCLPFSTMPPELANRIAAEIASVLAPAGRLVAYQARAQLPRHATPHLGAPEWQWEWFNIPPVRVFTWTKGLAQAR